MNTKTIKINLSNLKDFKMAEKLKKSLENKNWVFQGTIQTGVDTFESKFIKSKN